MEKVCIKGYKSFQDITLELGQINILIGSSGSGKSNSVERGGRKICGGS